MTYARLECDGRHVEEQIELRRLEGECLAIRQAMHVAGWDVSRQLLQAQRSVKKRRAVVGSRVKK